MFMVVNPICVMDKLNSIMAFVLKIKFNNAFCKWWKYVISIKNICKQLILRLYTRYSSSYKCTLRFCSRWIQLTLALSSYWRIKFQKFRFENWSGSIEVLWIIITRIVNSWRRNYDLVNCACIQGWREYLHDHILCNTAH